ncbi:hypothetical protein BSL82_02270 [Tardibacter chloracetimidivorans]|uniref:Peptidase S74 domain-containing protein n=1 Tax=Tardibacter chloracetimidivorans TaxID=1921510 RepID=A0A1L3ZRM2_9SPHN|nr:hypothetical protein [Tardibacter chloracetimidivorans]API58273.1 hypothetical protein BSL82_02270 [Tardibacter chloracetimidivorans]
MTQSANWPRGNGGGAVVRAAMNENDKANATVHKGPTPPTYADAAGWKWLDDSADPVWALRVYVGGTVSDTANWPVVWYFNRSTGGFGLGTAPGAPFQVAHPGEVSAGALADTINNATALFKTHKTNTQVTSIGGFSSGHGYIQRVNGAGITAYDLMLNPYGGNVILGTSAGPNHRVHKNVAQGVGVLDVDNGVSGAFFFSHTSGGQSSAATALAIGRNSVTSRSINAGGTINASGADYAEYVKKALGCGTIMAGQVCGINADGELVDQFDLAHSFVIKSTDPAYVGGDTWGSEELIGARPVAPLPPPENHPLYDLKLVEHADLMDAYNADLAAWEAALEAERVKYDRIAFSGQVPVNHIGAIVGDYIVAIRNPDGSIGTEAWALADMSMAQYAAAVGKVWKILDDGRAWVAVKVG